MKYISQITLAALVSWPACSLAGDIPATYKSSTGVVRSVLVTSALNSQNKPLVESYKNANGQWVPTTVVAETCGTTDLGAPLACNFLSTAQTNVANGVAGLDANGSVVASINTVSSVIAHSYIGAGWLPAWQNYTARPSFSSGWNNGDPFVYPNVTLIGGHEDHDDGYLKVTGSPWSMSDAGGALAAIYDTVGDQGTARNGAGNDDAISLFVGTQISPPRLRLGQDIVDSLAGGDGLARTVQLSGTSITVTPALNAAQIRLLRQWMRVYANYDAPGGNANGGSFWKNWNGDVDKGSVFIPNLYYGYIQSWSSSSTSTVLSVVSDPFSRQSGWRTESSSETVATAPGTNTGDIIDSASDSPTWTYKNPAVFIGLANKKFNMNQTVACLTTEEDTLSRQCEGNEIDLWGGNDAARRAINGLTITYGGARPANGSYNLSLAGGTANEIVMAPEWYTTAVQSDPLYVAPLAGPSLDVSGGNTTAVMASFAQSTNTGSNTFGPYMYIRPTIWTSRFASDGSGTDFQNETVSYGVSVGGKRGELGTIQEHIELNPQSAKNGIGLCGYNTCSYFDANGQIIAGGDIIPGTGKSLYTTDENGSRAAYMFANNSYQMNVAFNLPSGTSEINSGAQGAQTLHVEGGILADNNIVVGPNKAFGFQDSQGALIGYEYLVNASTSSGAEIHTVVSPKNGFNGTYYVDANTILESLKVTGDTVTNGRLNVGTYNLDSLPSSGSTDGAQVWCADCKLNGISGVLAYWHASASKWTDSQNGVLVN
ncbi:hypothetical protein MKW11_05290 [Gluconobacter frateurii]|uniref:hypothetical protein n=1 Tax=Gluconobacter frateurii TaxID=38308 RepID=UPI001F05AD9B|nr:hypothetical protein [Gluconobacter frateurii]UMM09478.1 hypothetical protein MKW11_05290 [Gluconobacter frateurii]